MTDHQNSTEETPIDNFLTVKDMSVYSLRLPKSLLIEVKRASRELDTTSSALLRWCIRKGLMQAKKRLYDGRDHM